MCGRLCAETLAILLSAVLVAGCAPNDAPPAEGPPSAPTEPVAVAPHSFADRVWVVAGSEQVAIGELRVFLSEGTLVMASPYGTPSFGTWRVRDGRLTITEEGRPYQVDILESSESDFRIRIHSPGEPVNIHFKRAHWVDGPRE
jgi:hypothetical protein